MEGKCRIELTVSEYYSAARLRVGLIYSTHSEKRLAKFDRRNSSNLGIGRTENIPRKSKYILARSQTPRASRCVSHRSQSRNFSSRRSRRSSFTLLRTPMVICEARGARSGRISDERLSASRRIPRNSGHAGSYVFKILIIRRTADWRRKQGGRTAGEFNHRVLCSVR